MREKMILSVAIFFCITILFGSCTKREMNRIEKKRGNWTLFVEKKTWYNNDTLNSELFLDTFFMTFIDDKKGVLRQGANGGQQDFTWNIQKVKGFLNSSNIIVNIYHLDKSRYYHLPFGHISKKHPSLHNSG